MMQSAALPRTLLVYGLSLFMAVALGFVLATPSDFFTFVLVFMVALALATPLLMRWHHIMLIFSLHASILIFFLPGQPYLWMLMSVISFGFTALHHTLDKQNTFINVPSVGWSLVILALVVCVTAKFTGGIGARMLGSGVYGGKRYYTTLAAILVYFALASQRIPRERALLYISLFLLSEVTAVLSNVAYMLGPSFWFLYAVFPTDLAFHQVKVDYLLDYGGGFSRITGISLTGHALFCYLLARYGVRGIISLEKPWRLAAFLAVIGVTLLGGFRSIVAFFLLVLIILFYVEKLYRTRAFLIILGLGLLGAIVVLPNLQRLPLSMQRSLSFLPFVRVSPVAQWDAQSSTEWRLSMWKLLVPEIPKRLLLGKGYAIDPTELYLVEESVKRGLAPSYESALTAGDFHNGPFSVLIPFGIWGMLAFGWFCVASLRVLFNNARYGRPEFRNYNALLLAMFLGKALFFFVFFGALSSELVLFTSLVGMSISLNGGVCRKADAATWSEADA